MAIGNETALKRAVALRGPVSVGIHASEKFTRYVSANGTGKFTEINLFYTFKKTGKTAQNTSEKGMVKYPYFYF